MKLTKIAAIAALPLAMYATSANAQTVYDENVPASFLVFPSFDIRGTTTTTLRIVNHDSTAVSVKLNYVCPGVKNVNDFCAALDTEIDLTPKQTRVIDVSDQNPPCNQGYVVAFAINAADEPIAFDFLTGSYNITEGRRDEADNAIGLQSPQSKGTVLGTGFPRQVRFGGADYSAISQNLFTDFRAVASEPDRGSKLTLLTLDVLAGMQNPPAVAFINFWNAAEVPFSTSREFVCWDQVTLDGIDANFLEENLGTTYGSMRIVGVPNCPLPGGCPPLLPYDATLLGAITEYGDGVLTGRTLNHDLLPKSTSYQAR